MFVFCAWHVAIVTGISNSLLNGRFLEEGCVFVFVVVIRVDGNAGAFEVD